MQEKCQFCGGIVTKKNCKLRPLEERKNSMCSRVYPQKVCEQCGEKYYSSKVYGIIDKLLKEKSKPDETMVVSCYIFEKSMRMKQQPSVSCIIQPPPLYLSPRPPSQFFLLLPLLIRLTAPQWERGAGGAFETKYYE